MSIHSTMRCDARVASRQNRRRACGCATSTPERARAHHRTYCAVQLTLADHGRRGGSVDAVAKPLASPTIHHQREQGVKMSSSIAATRGRRRRNARPCALARISIAVPVASRCEPGLLLRRLHGNGARSLGPDGRHPFRDPLMGDFLVLDLVQQSDRDGQRDQKVRRQPRQAHLREDDRRPGCAVRPPEDGSRDVLGWSDGGIEALLLGIPHPAKVKKDLMLRPRGVPPLSNFINNLQHIVHGITSCPSFEESIPLIHFHCFTVSFLTSSNSRLIFVNSDRILF